ncbi:hypothetical protein PR001_g30057, partial [Phytophthora rubi]
MTLELQPGESRGYWKYHVPGKHFRQVKANSKINNVGTVVLHDSGSEVSIIDATFARKIKLTLAGSLVYLYEVWVGDDLPPDYQSILGMDFMVPAGIRLDLGDGSMCLPNEIRVMLHGRRQIFSDKARPICVGEHLTVGIAESGELPLRLRETDNEKIWLTRGQDADRPTEEASVAADTPEAPAATAEEGAVSSEREDDSAQADEVLGQEPMRKVGPQAEGATRPPAQGATKQIPPEDRHASAPAPTPDTIPQGLSGQASKDPEPNPDPETRRGEPEGGSEVCYHDGDTLEAEEVDGEWAVLPEVSPATIEVRIEDLQVGDLADNTEDEIRKLRDIIWAHRHLLIGKGNALPPAAVGAICDIDVGNAAPIAQRVRKIAPQFREKVSDLLKGLLSAKIIRHSTSPWASPIVVIIKKNGVDIRLCIDYRLVNGLTKLMI